MNNLKDILYKVAVEAVFGNTDKEVSTVAFDSRKVSENGLFVAIKGTITDGHQYIDAVIEKGLLQLFAKKYLKKKMRMLLMFKCWIQIKHWQLSLQIIMIILQKN